MAEGYGGAKPKTRSRDGNAGKAKKGRVDKSSSAFTLQSVKNHNAVEKPGVATARCFSDNLNMTDYKAKNSVDEIYFLEGVEHIQTKSPKFEDTDTELNSARINYNNVTNVNPSNGLKFPLSDCSGEKFDGIRFQEFGKLSKEKEQEYLSARERWKKSGLALRKYIAEKLGFRQDERTKNSFERVKKQENGVKRKSENIQLVKKRNNLQGSESFKDESVMPRSKSFLRYFGFGKENGSNRASQGGMKSSKSFDASSSDAWPESSTDTCKSTSDWSADNTLTNQSSDNNIWTNQKCRGTQTQNPTNCKCQKGAKAKKAHECKHKSKSHRHLKQQKSNKDSTKNDSLKSDQSKKKTGLDKEKWIGILDNEIPSSSEGEEEFEYVLDPEYGEIVRRAKSRKPRSSSGQSNSKNTDTGSRGSQEIRDSTYEALLTLHHAIPYLPESFRNRLQSTSADLGQTSHDTTNSNSSGEVTLNNTGEVTLNNTKVKASREKNTELGYSITGDKHLQSSKNSLVEKRKQTQRDEKNLKKFNKDKSNWKRRLDESDQSCIDKRYESYDMVEDFENTLEDPFNVKSDSKIDLCSGLMDLVREIDIPFIDEDGETKFDNIGKERSARQRDVTDKYSGVMPDICDTSGFSPDVRIPLNCHVGTSAGDNSERLSRNCIGMLNCSSGTREARTNRVEDKDFYGNIVGSPETSFEDDPDYPGMRTLNDSFNRLLGDDDTDTSTDSSVLPNFMQRSSRSDESGSRSKSSDDSIEADDEFECECEHCQLLRQHSYGTSNLDLLPPRLYTEDMGFPYDLESSASGQTDTESSTGFRSAMFLEDYDFLLDRSNNELDWLIVDSRPLSLMLEDVIQQMLAVQPELLSEQAAPPAPQIVIENLPTIPLTLSHIDQHPSCPICLCLCEVEELMTLLPCQHIFHPICIQAWLIKSGTCPVCRAKLNK